MAHLLKPFNAQRTQRHSDSILQAEQVEDLNLMNMRYYRVCQIWNPLFTMKRGNSTSTELS